MRDFSKHMDLDYGSLVRSIRDRARADESLDPIDTCVKPWYYIVDKRPAVHRVVGYHTVPHTQASLRRIVKAGADTGLTGPKLTEIRTWIANTLLQVDSAMLLNLRHIFIIRSYDDLYELSMKEGYPVETAPEVLTSGTGELSQVTGVLYWHHVNALIVNMEAVENNVWLKAKSIHGPDKQGKAILHMLWHPLLRQLRVLYHKGRLFDLPWDEKTDDNDCLYYAEANDYATWAIDNLVF